MGQNKESSFHLNGPRVVTFRESVHVKLIRYTSSCSDSSSTHSSKFWYTPQELKTMVRENTVLCQGFDEVARNDCISFLGLETSAFRLKRRQRMEAARLAVFSEQASRLDTRSRTDDDRVPTTYESCSRESQMLALDRGKELSLSLFMEEVKRLYGVDDVFTIHRAAYSSSPIGGHPGGWCHEDSSSISSPRHSPQTLTALPFLAKPAK